MKEATKSIYFLWAYYTPIGLYGTGLSIKNPHYYEDQGCTWQEIYEKLNFPNHSYVHRMSFEISRRGRISYRLKGKDTWRLTNIPVPKLQDFIDLADWVGCIINPLLYET